ncbi:MAG: flagellar FliJ family protein [Candidatus Hydrogenedentes bacterium]|nr:flagellar FliJ family protein [Candidatus Hydrogenedentota bacterium]
MLRSSKSRFDTLVRVRRLQENLRAQALASVRRDIRLATNERDELETQQRSMLEEAGRKSEHTFTAGEVRRFYQYERHLARLAVEKDAAIAQLRRNENVKLGELNEATIRKRTVERLSERAAEVYAAWVRKEAQAVTDETATNKAAVARQAERE